MSDRGWAEAYPKWNAIYLKGVFAMKNNDFDFIKNRFDSVEPSMPDSLNKEILRQKISSNEEH